MNEPFEHRRAGADGLKVGSRLWDRNAHKAVSSLVIRDARRGNLIVISIAYDIALVQNGVGDTQGTPGTCIAGARANQLPLRRMGLR
jgi:hypothetical protein